MEAAEAGARSNGNVLDGGSSDNVEEGDDLDALLALDGSFGLNSSAVGEASRTTTMDADDELLLLSPTTSLLLHQHLAAGESPTSSPPNADAVLSPATAAMLLFQSPLTADASSGSAVHTLSPTTLLNSLLETMSEDPLLAPPLTTKGSGSGTNSADDFASLLAAAAAVTDTAADTKVIVSTKSPNDALLSEQLGIEEQVEAHYEPALSTTTAEESSSAAMIKPQRDSAEAATDADVFLEPSLSHSRPVFSGGSVDFAAETSSSDGFQSFVTANMDDADASTLASKESTVATSTTAVGIGPAAAVAEDNDEDTLGRAVSFMASSSLTVLEQQQEHSLRSFVVDERPSDDGYGSNASLQDYPSTPKRSGREALVIDDDAKEKAPRVVQEKSAAIDATALTPSHINGSSSLSSSKEYAAVAHDNLAVRDKAPVDDPFAAPSSSRDLLVMDEQQQSAALTYSKDVILSEKLPFMEYVSPVSETATVAIRDNAADSQFVSPAVVDVDDGHIPTVEVVQPSDDQVPATESTAASPVPPCLSSSVKAFLAVPSLEEGTAAVQVDASVDADAAKVETRATAPEGVAAKITEQVPTESNSGSAADEAVPVHGKTSSDPILDGSPPSSNVSSSETPTNTIISENVVRETSVEAGKTPVGDTTERIEPQASLTPVVDPSPDRAEIGSYCAMKAAAPTSKAVFAATKEGVTVPVDSSPPAPPPNDEDFPDSEDGPLAVSPLSQKRILESSLAQQVFRSKEKFKTLQVEFPSVLDSGLKRSDVSLSSASSTISHGSFTRGVASSGIATPSNAEELQQRKSNCGDSLPPRFPKKGKELNENPMSFVDSVSKKLVVQENASDDAERVETRWIKQSLPSSFNPKKSIFAGKQEATKGPAMSPPGSPPEPYYSDFGDGDSTHGESRGSSSNSLVLNAEAGTWDMMLECVRISPLDTGENRPDFFVSMSEPGSSFLHPAVAPSDDFGTESSLAPSETELGKSSRDSTTHMKSFLIDASYSPAAIKHRGMIRGLSFTSRGSGRRSVSSGASRGRGSGSRDPNMLAIPTVRSDGPHIMPSKRADSETVSLGGRSTSPEPRHHCKQSLHGLHQSSPDLRRLAELQRSSKVVSPVKVLVPGVDGDRPCIAYTDSADVRSPDPMRIAKFNDDETDEPEHKGALLEEELLAFSSIRRIDLPFRYTNPVDSLNYTGSARWRQLVACWKHSEILRAMMTRSPSSHFVDKSGREREDVTWYGGSSGRHGRTSSGDIELHGVSIKACRVQPGTKNFDGFSPQHREFTLSSITRFLAGVGGWPSETSGLTLRHELSSSGNVTVQDLLSAADSNATLLTSLIKDIVAFASMNSPGIDESVADTTRFSVGVKDHQAIENKAKLKYNGNIQHVKDVLRAQITFADEGTLICGLLRLFRITGLLSIDEDSDSGADVKLVRMKNLLCSDSLLGNLSTSPLPTGYRHLLLNLRLKDGLLAEIQFNLSPLFDVLGQKGYALHRELLDLQHAFDMSEKSCDAVSSFDMNDLIGEAVGCCSLSSTGNSLFDAFSSVPAAKYGFAKHSEGRTTPTKSGSQSVTDGDTPQTKNKGKVGSEMEGATDLKSPNADLPVHGLDKVGGELPSKGELGDKSAAVSTPIISISTEPDCMADAIGDNVIVQKVATLDPSNATSPTSHNTSRKRTDETPSEARRRLLEDLSARGCVLTGGDVFLAILDYGCSAASGNPRDVATFYCLYALFSFIVKRERDEELSGLGFGVRTASDVIEYSQQCLLRCLKISNQAISTGMTGWLEYGCSSSLDRLTERPFVVLRHLAYDLGRRNQWDECECVCLALVVRCEQYLPLYHPTTLTSLLDLAIAASMVGKTTFAGRIVSRAAERLSAYLSEMESEYLSHLSRCRSSVVKPGDTIFRIEHGRDASFMLHAFVSLFRSHLVRDITVLVGRNNEIILTNHCFVADSLAVLANCLAAAKSSLGSTSGSVGGDEAHYWQLAFAHYRLAFNGFSKTKGLDDPSVSKSAYGLARCLREFGETEKALQLLLLVVSYTDRTTVDSDAKEPTASSAGPAGETEIGDDSKDDLTVLPRFLPFSLSSKTVSDKTRAAKHTSSALCLWLMAILSLDQSPNEEGRERAFSYLHAASVSLQSALNIVSVVEDEATKTMCIRFLAMIEDEAMQISEPIYE